MHIFLQLFFVCLKWLDDFLCDLFFFSLNKYIYLWRRYTVKCKYLLYIFLCVCLFFHVIFFWLNLWHENPRLENDTSSSISTLCTSYKTWLLWTLKFHTFRHNVCLCQKRQKNITWFCLLPLGLLKFHTISATLTHLH